MRYVTMLVGVIVLGASVAASAQVVTRDQLRQYFLGGDAYNQGFRAGYAAGVADAARAAYGNPGVITQGVTLCAQNQTFPTLVQMASAAVQQWLAGGSSNAIAAVQILGAYNTCSTGQVRDQGDKGK
ncbi:MAG TPA: hypothetical protein VJT32_13910 [bacterium]|nr:hypothetical protein [bacterium]